MQLNHVETIRSGRIDDVVVVQLDDGPEERAIAGDWELPVSMFTSVGYYEHQVIPGLSFEYMIRKLNGAPLKASCFKGIIPPVELVNN